MQGSNSTLVLRRNRRILRSKVYLLLKSNRIDKDFEILKSNLNQAELEEVIEDACYYIPFPEKLKMIKEKTQTIEEIVDNSSKPKVSPPPKPEKKRKNFRKPTELMPFQRNPTLLSQKTIEKFPVIKKRETVNNKEHLAKSLIRKIDLSKTLLDEPAEKTNKKPNEKIKTFLKYEKVFRDIENNYHQTLKKNYFLETLKKNRTRAWASSCSLNQSLH